MKNDSHDVDLTKPISGESNTESLREYGRMLAMDELLRECFSKERSREVFAEEKVSSWSRHGLKIIAIAAIILVCLGVSYLNVSAPKPEIIVVSQVVGSAVVLDRAGAEVELKVDDEIPSGAMIMTGVGSTLAIEYADGSLLKVAEQSELMIAGVDEGKKVMLDEGSALFKVAKQPSGQHFIVETRDAKATVLGATFELFTGLEYTELVVTEGKVSFQDLSAKNQFVVEEDQYSLIGMNLALVDVWDDNEPKVESFSIVSLVTNAAVPQYSNMSGSQTIQLSDLPEGQFTIVANTSGSTKSVYFDRSDLTKTFEEHLPPYAIQGDRITQGGDYLPMSVSPGRLKITAEACDRDGNLGAPVVLKLNFVQ